MIMRLSTKSQVTIPQEVREQAGIGPGAAVDIIYTDNGVIELRAVDGDRLAPGHQALAALRTARGRVTLTTEEIMAMTRDWDVDTTTSGQA